MKHNYVYVRMLIKILLSIKVYCDLLFVISIIINTIITINTLQGFAAYYFCQSTSYLLVVMQNNVSGNKSANTVVRFKN